MNNAGSITLPDRYDVLKSASTGDLHQIIVPVHEALKRIDAMVEDMNSSLRGSFLILKGSSGSGKSTFANTIGFFREGIETINFSRSVDIATELDKLGPTSSSLRIAILEGREAITDVQQIALERAIHAINQFIRTPAGRKTIVIWLVNKDDLAQNLASLAFDLGGESLVGLDESVYLFTGPLDTQYIDIANRTLALLNQGESLTDLGIGADRSKELLALAPTIGSFLAYVRKDLVANRSTLLSLVPKEQCRVWFIVIAGNEPDSDVDGLTRGTVFSADVDRMLSVTEANVVAELKQYPEKIGLLGTFFDARILHVPIITALSLARTYGSPALRTRMAAEGMATIADKQALTRLKECSLGLSFSKSKIGPRKVGGKAGSNTIDAFEKLAKIASKNDAWLNVAVAEGLVEAGLVSSFLPEQDFGNGLTRRTDIVGFTDDGPIRLEFMWRKATGRAAIANYVLSKLFNYGRAISYLQ